jgi:hypothetical protein
MDDPCFEPWSNTACLGYVTSALENLEVEPEKITQAVMELRELFDWMTPEDAAGVFTASDYE